MSRSLVIQSLKITWMDRVSLSTVMLCLSFSLLAAEPQIAFLEPPVTENSSLSRLTRDGSGVVFLSWVEQKDAIAHLKYATLEHGNWSTPKEISSGTDWFINWADFPALSVNQDNLVAHWLKMSAEGTYDYDIRARFFSEKLSSLSEVKTLHNDGVNAEHGFVSMLPLGQNQTLISWLDGRQTKSETGETAMTLRAGIFDEKGNVSGEWQLDNRVCDCCQTSTALTSKGPVVVYRDRSDNEIRDIYITRFLNGTWSEPRAVYNDGWEIAGCPVNGPAAAATEQTLAVSWFSAKDDTPEVKLAISSDGGESFIAPVKVAGPETIGRLDTAVLESGKIAVSWINTASDVAQIMISVYDTDGALVHLTEVADIDVSRRSGFPSIESVGESVYVSWTDLSLGPKVRMAQVVY